MMCNCMKLPASLERSIVNIQKQKQQFEVKFETIDNIKVVIDGIWADDVENAIFEARRMLTEQLECVAVERKL